VAEEIQWRDMVNWILQSLLSSGERWITQDSAHSFPEPAFYGEAFKNAITAVGNYGESLSFQPS
jgi:hypothetical protein